MRFIGGHCVRWMGLLAREHCSRRRRRLLTRWQRLRVIGALHCLLLVDCLGGGLRHAVWPLYGIMTPVRAASFCLCRRLHHIAKWRLHGWCW